MKYYKRIKQRIKHNGCLVFEVGKIYPENYEHETYISVKDSVEDFSERWLEVTPAEYYVQEGIMPENYIVVCNNSAESSKVLNSNTKENKQWQHWTYCYTWDKDSTGFGITRTLSDRLKDYIVFSFEQWDQIVNKNKMEEFVLPNFWQIERNKDNYEIVNNWMNKHHHVSDIAYKYSDCSGFANNKNIQKISDDSLLQITTEQFIKYVLKEEVMNDIIGWKLKDEYSNYKSAALAICDTVSNWQNSLKTYDISANQKGYLSKLEQAGVLELWFEPVYFQKFKEGDWVVYWKDSYLNITAFELNDVIQVIDGKAAGKVPFKGVRDITDCFRLATPEEIKAIQTLKFGGYDVTFEKVTSGVRITCNGENFNLDFIISKKEINSFIDVCRNMGIY